MPDEYEGLMQCHAYDLSDGDEFYFDSGGLGTRMLHVETMTDYVWYMPVDGGSKMQMTKNSIVYRVV